MSRFLLTLALSTLSLVRATPWDNLVADIAPSSVRYASIPCTCSSATRSTTTKFTSQEGFGFTLNSALTGDCTNPITSFTLTAATQSLTQATFFVQYDGQCPITQDCSQVRCQANNNAGAQTLSCSFPKPAGYTNKMYVYMLWQTTSAPGNRQYPLPHPAFIPLNFDCAAAASYSSGCNNGVCGCAAGEVGSSCPTAAPVVITTSAPVVSTTSAPVVNNPNPIPATSSPTTSTVTNPVVTTPVVTNPVPPTPTAAPTGPRLVFSEDFNKLDCSVWEHQKTLAGDGNWSFQQYTNNRTNSFVRNGKLYIKPTFTSAIIGEGAVRGVPSYTMDLTSLEPAMQCTGGAFYGCQRTSTNENYLNPIQSASLRTSSSFSFKYGRVEVSAKLPKGDWLWPAIWLLPRHAQYGQWPMSGEIDIMESRGNAPGYTSGGYDAIGSTLHWGPYYGQNPFHLTHGDYVASNPTSLTDSFHTYGLYWDSTGLYTYIDDDKNKIMTVNWTSTTFYERGNFAKVGAHNPWLGSSQGAPFDQEFYLILNVAVGSAGGYFPPGPERPWRNDEFAMKSFWDSRAQWLPSWKGDDVAMQVDSVKVWQY